MSKKNKTNEKKYSIQGMHCSACEILIRQDIENIEGIKKADVSLGAAQVVIHAKSKKDIPSANSLNKIFNEAGYTFYEGLAKDKPLKRNDIHKVLVLAALFIIIFYFFEKSNFLGRYSINAGSSLFAFFLFGMAAGLSSCAALVGGLLLSVSKKWNDIYSNDSRKSILPFLYFNGSRIITFALLGGLLGFFGSFFKISITATAVVAILISLLMVVLGLQMLGIEWFRKISFNFVPRNPYLNRNKEFQGKYVPILVGASTFLIPCGFTIIAQTNALNSGSFYLGFMQLLAFSLGTLPVLGLISFSSVKFYSNPVFAKRFSIFSGILIVFFALYTLNAQLNVLGIKSLSDIRFSDAAESEPIYKQGGKDYQVMNMEAKGFEYSPRVITIKSGVRTVWNIYEEKTLGCAKAVYARGLYKDVIYLKPGLNSVEFTAPKKGTYKISCSMGMVNPVTVKVI